MVWIMFMIITNVGTHPTGSISFQQEFRTAKECHTGASLIKNQFGNSWTRINHICLEVRK